MWVDMVIFAISYKEIFPKCIYVDDPGSNHMNTWRIAYHIEGLRDWLFSQEKTN